MDDLLDVHVGTEAPTEWDRLEKQQANYAKDSPARRTRPRIAAEELPWTEVGLRPRWVGDDTSQSVAAIDPCDYHGRGASELERFCRGARQRTELALFLWSFGDLEDAEPSPLRSLFGSDAAVRFPRIDTHWVAGSLIRLAAQPSLADDLTGADRDLALRLAQRPLHLPWWSLQLTVERPGVFFGSWTPLLTTPAGEVVAGVWTDHAEGDPAGALERHYVLPALESYRPILQWLAEHGVPELIPGAARRSHRYVSDLPELQTGQERTLLQRIDQLTRDYDEQKATLAAELAAERARADQVRDPLLFGGGGDLEAAVARVLTDAGLLVTPLDPQLGTKSADLLVELAGRRLLVEVKASSGRPKEDLVEAARRHLRTWPQLRGDVTVDGAALVINHQHRTPPVDRSSQAYERREFVGSLDDVVVVTTPQLYDWWRRSQWDAVRAAFGYSDREPSADRNEHAAAQLPSAGPRPWWRRRR